MRKGIIYKWTNKINNKCYIGRTINEYQRKYQHLNDRRNFSAFHLALDKYGLENFDYQVLFETKSNDDAKLNYLLNTMECYYIKRYKSDSKEFGYNLTRGGGGISGRFGEKNPFFRHHHTEEWKKEHSNALKGRVQSNEEKQKRTESLKKVVHTKEWNQKVSRACSIGVIAYKDGVEVARFCSYQECVDGLGLTGKQGITNVIKGKSKTYKGYYFVQMSKEDKEKLSLLLR